MKIYKTVALLLFYLSVSSAVGADLAQPLRDVPKPGLAFTEKGTIRNEGYKMVFFEATWDGGGKTYVHDTYIHNKDDGWVLLNSKEERFADQWVIFKSKKVKKGIDVDYYSTSDARSWVAFSSYRKIDSRTVELTAAHAGMYRLKVRWSLEDPNPEANIVLTPATSEFYTVGYQSFTPEKLSDINEVLCGILQHSKRVRGRESFSHFRLSAPMSLVEKTLASGTYTRGIFMCSEMFVFEEFESLFKDKQHCGLSLQNHDDAIQPSIYTPQIGRLNRMKADVDYSYTFGLYAKKKTIYEAYKDLALNEYDFSDYRRNVFGQNLTDAMHNMIDLIMTDSGKDDSVDFVPSPSGWWSRAKGFVDIENYQTVRTSTTGVLLSAYYLTGDDELYYKRALPMIEYHVSRNGYGWTPKKGHSVYGDKSKWKMCGVPFDTACLGPLYNFTKSRVPAIYELALSKMDSPDDLWLKRLPMNTPLAAYRMTQDEDYLKQATQVSDAYVTERVDAPYPRDYNELDFSIYYSPAWLELLEMYETTEDTKYLDASYKAAKLFITQTFLRPVPSGKATFPIPPIRISNHERWKPRITQWYERTEFTPEVAEKWLASWNGITIEQMTTHTANGPQLLPAWSAFLLRLAYYKNDSFMRDMVRNQIVGRYTNYPGYKLPGLVVEQMHPDYPLVGPWQKIFYHHIPIHLGMTIDYLITENVTRSDKNIDFPAEFEANYVWFKTRTYGHKPGRFYGDEGVWLWMPRNIISTDNYLVNWMTAENGKNFFISLTNSSKEAQDISVTLNDAIIGFDPAASYEVTMIKDNGTPVTRTMTGGKIATTVSPKGITAIKVSGMNISVPLHVDYSDAERDTTNKSYCFDRFDSGMAGAEESKVRGMLILKPDKTSYDAYIQTDIHSDKKMPVTLYYSIDGGATYRSSQDSIYPYEWTIHVEDISKSFHYYLQVPNGRKSEPVPLWLDEYKGPPLKREIQLHPEVKTTTPSAAPPAWLKGLGPNLAKDAAITVTGSLNLAKYPVKHLQDGKVSYTDNDLRWISSRQLPIRIDLAWDSPKKVAAFRVVSGHRRPGASSTSGAIEDFKLQYKIGDKFVDLPKGTITGNQKVDWTLHLPAAITTDAIRLEITKTPDNLARIWEIELYSDPSLKDAEPPLAVAPTRSAVGSAGKVPTILALGDSITQGSRRFVCYRQVLVPELRKKNVGFKFIGPNKDATSAHAGYGGKNTAYLLSISKEIYSQYPADIVLIHSGHNSFSENKPVKGIVRDTHAIIDTMREINPDVKILLAQVIPAGKLPKYAYIPELNKELASLAERLNQQGYNIVLVNQADGFDWKTDTIGDKVHPNANGAKKMANKWMPALLQALGHTSLSSYEQLRLWPGDAPGVEANRSSEKDLPRGRVSQVSVPTLDVYRPHKANGITLIICSGGGYSKLASGPLGIGAADEFLKDGYTVCSLKYRLSPPSTNVVQDACMDGARALRLIRSHAKEWNIDPERIGMIGFSAGSNMILNLACKNERGDPNAKDPLERLSGHPDFIVLAALWLNHQKKISDWRIHSKLPPTLILGARDDQTAPVEKSEEIAHALREAQVPVQLEIYDNGGHSAFNFPSPNAADWPQRFRKWIKQS